MADIESGIGTNDRHIFVLRIYIILFFQLLLTIGLSMLFMINQIIKEFVQKNLSMLITAIVLSFVFLIILACCGNIAKTAPWNYIFLFLFTLVEGYMVGVVSSFYDTTIVLMALIITLGVVIGLSLFACQTTFDFTGAGPYLSSFLMVFLMCGILNMYLCYVGKCQVLNTVYSMLGALVFSMYIVYDTQLIIGGSHMKYEFSDDEYVFAALNLYLDVVNLFLYILSLLGDTDE